MGKEIEWLREGIGKRKLRITGSFLCGNSLLRTLIPNLGMRGPYLEGSCLSLPNGELKEPPYQECLNKSVRRET